MVITQLTLWDIEEEHPEPPMQGPELDAWRAWRRATIQYDHKRFKQGWRPWHKKENQNDSGSG